MPDKIYFKCPQRFLTTELYPEDLSPRNARKYQLKLKNLNMTEEQMQNWLYELIQKDIDILNVKMQFLTEKIFSNPNRPQTDTQKALFEKFERAKAQIMNEKELFFQSYSDKTKAEIDYRFLVEFKNNFLKCGMMFHILDEKNNVQYWKKYQYTLQQIIKAGIHLFPGIQPYLKKLMEFLASNTHRLRIFLTLNSKGLFDTTILAVISQGKVSDELLDFMLRVAPEENLIESFKMLIENPHFPLFIELQKIVGRYDKELILSELIQNLAPLSDNDLRDFTNFILKLRNDFRAAKRADYSFLRDLSFLKSSNPSLMINILMDIVDKSSQYFVYMEEFLTLISQQKHAYLPIFKRLLDEVGVEKTYDILQQKLSDNFLEQLVLPNLDKIKKFGNLGVFLKILEYASPRLKQSLIENHEKFVDIINHHAFVDITTHGFQFYFNKFRELQLSEVMDFLIESPNSENFITKISSFAAYRKDFKEICLILIKFQGIREFDSSLLENVFRNKDYQKIFSHPESNSILHIYQQIRGDMGDTRVLSALSNLTNVRPLLNYLEKNPEQAAKVHQLISSNQEADIVELIKNASQSHDAEAYLGIACCFSTLEKNVQAQLLSCQDLQILWAISKKHLIYFSPVSDGLNALKFLLEQSSSQLKQVESYLNVIFPPQTISFQRYLFFELLRTVPEVLRLGDKFVPQAFQLYEKIKAFQMSLNAQEILRKLCLIEYGMDLSVTLMNIGTNEKIYTNYFSDSEFNSILTSQNIAEIARFCHFHPLSSFGVLNLLVNHDNLPLLNDKLSQMSEEDRATFLTHLNTVHLTSPEQMNLLMTNHAPLELIQLVKDYHLFHNVDIKQLTNLVEEPNFLALKELLNRTFEKDEYNYLDHKTFFQMLHAIPQILNCVEFYGSSMFKLYQYHHSSIHDFPKIFENLLTLPHGTDLCHELTKKRNTWDSVSDAWIEKILTSKNLAEIARFCYLAPNSSSSLLISLVDYTQLKDLNDVLSSMAAAERKILVPWLEKVVVDNSGYLLIDYILKHKKNIEVVKLLTAINFMSLSQPYQHDILKDLEAHPNIAELTALINLIKQQEGERFVQLNLEIILKLKQPEIVKERYSQVIEKTFDNTYVSWVDDNLKVLCLQMIDKLPDMKMDNYDHVVFSVFTKFHQSPDVSKVFSKIWEYPNWKYLCSLLLSICEKSSLSIEDSVSLVLSGRLEKISEFLASNRYGGKNLSLNLILKIEQLPWFFEFIQNIGEHAVIFNKFADFDAQDINRLINKLMSSNCPLDFIIKLECALDNHANVKEHFVGALGLVERLNEFDNETFLEVYQCFVSTDFIWNVLLSLMENIPGLDGLTLIRIAQHPDMENLFKIFNHLQTAKLLSGEQRLNYISLSLLLDQDDLADCLNKVQILNDANELNQKTFEKLISQNHLMEPIKEKYLMIDEKYNHVHVLLPISSGEEIALDNTCKSTQSLKEFFGYAADSKSIGVVIQEYIYALQKDINILRPGTELYEQKQERLSQLLQYQASIDEVNKLSDVQRLELLYPEFPEGIQQLMKKNGANLSSIQLMPHYPDGYLRTINPAFSLRELETDRFAQQLRTTLSHHKLPVISLREHFTTQVLDEAAKGTELTFSRLQEILHEKTLEFFGEDIDYQSVNITDICNIFSVEESELASDPQIFVDGLLGFAAGALFDSTLASPFSQQTLTTDRDLRIDEQSILIQFFLAEINIYCQQNGLGHENFGLKLQNADLRHAFMTCLRDLQGNVELAIAEFVNQHKEAFGLSRDLTIAEMKVIKQKFAEHFILVKHSPHFDEFMLLNLEKKGGFYTHQASICVNYLDFLNASIPEYMNAQMLEILTQSEQLPVKLEHQNLWVDPGQHVKHLNVIQMSELVERGYPFGFLMSKLNDFQQIEVLKNLGEHLFDILAYPTELKCLTGNLSEKSLDFLLDCAIVYGRTKEVSSIMTAEKQLLLDFFQGLSPEFEKESQLIRAILRRCDDDIDEQFESFPRMPTEFIEAVFKQKYILSRINEILQERDAAPLEKPEDLAIYRNSTSEYRQRLRGSSENSFDDTPNHSSKRLL